jgi:hypothetical protein
MGVHAKIESPNNITNGVWNYMFSFIGIGICDDLYDERDAVKWYYSKISGAITARSPRNI